MLIPLLGLLLGFAAAGVTIELEYECGDLNSCRYLNDGECDDGGPAAKCALQSP